MKQSSPFAWLLDCFAYARNDGVAHSLAIPISLITRAYLAS
jgi:hypothetical protein